MTYNQIQYLATRKNKQIWLAQNWVNMEAASVVWVESDGR